MGWAWYPRHRRHLHQAPHLVGRQLAGEEVVELGQRRHRVHPQRQHSREGTDADPRDEDQGPHQGLDGARAADFDQDGDQDLLDWAAIQFCYSDSGGVAVPICRCVFDADADADADADSDAEFRGDSYYRGYEGYGPYGPYGPWTPYPPAPMLPPPAPMMAPPPPVPAPAPAEPATAAVSIDDDGDGVMNAGDFCPDTVEGTRVDAFGCAIDESIVLRGVNFLTNSDELTQESIAILDAVAGTLLQNPDLKLEVSGHTDSDGDDAYNKELSQRRAQSVVDYLGGSGVDPNNMIAKGFEVKAAE